MNGLPLELIDSVFWWLDGVSLAKSRKVCRQWRELHQQPNYKSLWKEICFKEIDKDIIRELTGCCNSHSVYELRSQITQKDKLKNDVDALNYEVDWELVYKQWYRSRHIGKWPSLTTELKGHNGPIWDVKLSGDRVVTCGADATIRIWDGWTGQCLRILTGHLRGVLCIDLRKRPGVSPSSEKPHDLIVSGSQDNSISIWDMDKGVCLLSLFGHTHCVNSVSVQEGIIISGADETSAKVWDFEQDSPDITFSLSGHDDWVKSVSLWDNRIFSATDNGLMSLWSLDNGELLASVRISTGGKGIAGAVLRGDTALVLSCSGRITAWTGSEASADAAVLRSFSIVGQGSSVPRDSYSCEKWEVQSQCRRYGR
ncbi:probable E3 ubiquitin ligase complex SCF subunit scon-2 isoform X2 [Nematostella vectensis]|uniref:probable E3 ubiquitin ligase complex SCF subunit scon-2 isoform X2 n=1 Tax=Nematostella vectensis TaxID=45351 RepID=UPI0020779228|nr:probable E3 ubiquitin ligase complex SCF subunit scon-2 isoform X2 [Nematostella vectensis]